ncbi:hypothetical protein OQJ65_17140 [Vibrio sp. Sgm 22]|uniref:hypothetical protein n=1 Tax=unclassified Vibrio TaxID=2614977 RepID=UPI0022494D79|nr:MULTISPECIES: hypothetical protein [unclassified Vibrio]MCX2760061.1 hypothetical protein [Vibrio sp. 14G-20]MCX2777049.1 hypothetical protein [Vibrio sp. Sgm 22]
MLKITRGVGQSGILTDEPGNFLFEMKICDKTKGQVGLGITSDKETIKIFRAEKAIESPTKVWSNVSR